MPSAAVQEAGLVSRRLAVCCGAQGGQVTPGSSKQSVPACAQLGCPIRRCRVLASARCLASLGPEGRYKSTIKLCEHPRPRTRAPASLLTPPLECLLGSPWVVQAGTPTRPPARCRHAQPCPQGHPTNSAAAAHLPGGAPVMGCTFRKAPTAPRNPSCRRNRAFISPCSRSRPGCVAC